MSISLEREERGVKDLWMEWMEGNEQRQLLKLSQNSAVFSTKFQMGYNVFHIAQTIEKYSLK